MGLTGGSDGSPMESVTPGNDDSTARSLGERFRARGRMLKPSARIMGILAGLTAALVTGGVAGGVMGALAVSALILLLGLLAVLAVPIIGFTANQRSLTHKGHALAKTVEEVRALKASDAGAFTQPLAAILRKMSVKDIYHETSQSPAADQCPSPPNLLSSSTDNEGVNTSSAVSLTALAEELIESYGKIMEEQLRLRAKQQQIVTRLDDLARSMDQLGDSRDKESGVDASPAASSSERPKKDR